MAGLPLFNESFRRWMVDSTLPSTKESSIAASDHIFMTTPNSVSPPPGSPKHTICVRQPGIRANIDESWDLPTSNVIMEHLAESCHGRNDRHIGTDGQRVPSYTSSIDLHSVDFAKRDSYDHIEAEIEKLKEDVMRLRQTEEELANKTSFASADHPDPEMLPQYNRESAAARLQRLHETTKTAGVVTQDEQSQVTRPPTLVDFPALDGNARKSTAAEASADPSSRLRKLSYADVAIAGMANALGYGVSTSSVNHEDTKLSDSSFDEPSIVASVPSPNHTAAAAPPLGSIGLEDGDHDSVIVSTQDSRHRSLKTNETATANLTRPAADNKFVKHPPHFAQPTQSFSRRTGETVRKEAAGMSLRSPAETSPGRFTVTKAPNLATNGRANQRDSKRKSLPGEWVGGSAENKSEFKPQVFRENEKAVPATPQKLPSPASVVSPASVGSPKAGKSDPNGLHDAVRTKFADPPSRSSPSKKKGSYMSPTAAVTQRNLATVGQESPARDSPGSKQGTKAIKAAEDEQMAPGRLRSCTLSSDQSSVHFILDKRSPNAIKNPLECSDTRNQLKIARPSPIDSMEFPKVSMKGPASPQKMASGNVSRIPKATVSLTQTPPQATTPASSDLSLSKMTCLSSLVKSTTTKRRMSHGHILKPIVAHLHGKGLLNKESMDNEVIRSYLECSSAEPNLGDPNAQNAETRQPPGAFTSADGGAAEGLVLSSAHQHIPHPVSNVEDRGYEDIHMDAMISQNAWVNTSDNLPPYYPTLSTPDEPAAVRSKILDQYKSSCLRATASEFTPQQPVQSGLDRFDHPLTMSWIPQEQWMGMSQEERKAVTILRDMQCRNGVQPWNTPLRYQSPPGAPQRFAAHKSLPKLTTQDILSDPTIRSVDDNGSPKVVQAGQVLRPNFSPGKKTMQWMLHDLDGKETPIKFGRAPPPDILSSLQRSTPTLSPTTDDTSPSKSPNSLSSWHIGSTVSRAPYAWSGGDGKEIRFVGYGPHAERDPNNVVDFNYQGRTASYHVSVPNGFHEDKENFHAQTRVAPKSQRQWAEKVGYPKIPCGNVEITDAVEYCVPFGSQHLHGYCHGCVG